MQLATDNSETSLLANTKREYAVLVNNY